MQILKSEILDFVEKPISFLRIKYGQNFHDIWDENGFTLLHHLIYHIMNDANTNRRSFISKCHELADYQFDYNCFSTHYNTEHLLHNKVDKIVKYPSVINPLYLFLPAFKEPALLADLHNSGLLNSLIPQFESIYDKQGINIFFTAVYFNELDYIMWAISHKVSLLNEILYTKQQDLYDFIRVSQLGEVSHNNLNQFYQFNYKEQIIEAVKNETKWEIIIEKHKLEQVISNSTQTGKTQKL